LNKSACWKNPVAKVVTGMRSVEQAQAELLALCTPLSLETVPVAICYGRVVGVDVIADRAHPPFAASAMDGYAVRSDDVHHLPVTLRIVGESIAGKRFTHNVGAGQAVRILTGAPIPDDCDCVIVQEDVHRDGDSITVQAKPTTPAQHIRPAGLDVAPGQLLAATGTRISPALQGLLAAAGYQTVSAHRAPKLQLLACGDELKLPGEPLRPDDIVATNGLILSSLLKSAGAVVSGEDKIIADDLEALTYAIRESDADILVTIGGASVGDRDFVQAALQAAGCDIAFWKIALKPGKPMMVGTRGRQIIIGLPGNPVSAYVCALLFVLPAVRALQAQAQPLPQNLRGIAGVALAPGDTRTEYLRASAQLIDGQWLVTPYQRQDSSMLSTLAAANALLIRPAAAPAVAAGAPIWFMTLNA
jgi:molybdopterin molybdotransferase